MTKKITITNTTGQLKELLYRMPGETKQILRVQVIAYALNQVVTFSSEAHYEAFKRSNGHYFVGKEPELIEGKVFGNKVERIHDARAKEQEKKIQGEISKTENAVVGKAQESMKDFEVVVEKNQRGKEPTDLIAGKKSGRGKR